LPFVRLRSKSWFFQQAGRDEFAKKYALKSSRRIADFEKDIKKLRTAMIDQKLVLLEIDAYSKNSDKEDIKAVKKIFNDFSEE
jgi:phage host-nuclease inhibitor protein Gam